MQEAYSWYEEKQSGLGERFISVVEEAINIISNSSKSFPIKTKQYRQYPILKFPYVIIYEFIPKEDLIYILHIFNTHQDPEKKLRQGWISDNLSTHGQFVDIFEKFIASDKERLDLITNLNKAVLDLANEVNLFSIYDKSDKENISDKEIDDLLKSL